VPPGRGEVGEGAGDQGGEVVVEVGRGGVAAGAAIEEPHHRQVEVERQAVGAAGDDLADLLADKRFAVAGEPAGEVVVTVLGGEVAFTDSRCVRLDSELRRCVA
jgi:hypothetical protein